MWQRYLACTEKEKPGRPEDLRLAYEQTQWKGKSKSEITVKWKRPTYMIAKRGQ